MKGKRFLLLLLVFALSVSLLGCGEMSDAEVQLRYGLRMFFNRFNLFQPTSFTVFLEIIWMIWNGVRSSSGPAWRKTRPCFRNTQTPMRPFSCWFRSRLY